MRKLKLDELNRKSIEEYKESSKFPVVLVLDNIRSGVNVGSALRTADALGVERVYLCGITPKPPHREILKTAIGASDSVDWRSFENTIDACQELKSNGYTICALEQTSESISLEKVEFGEKKIALVFGNEVAGVDDGVLMACDYAIEIPQFGTKHSFNISVSLGIATWEILRKLKFI